MLVALSQRVFLMNFQEKKRTTNMAGAKLGERESSALASWTESAMWKGEGSNLLCENESRRVPVILQEYAIEKIWLVSVDSERSASTSAKKNALVTLEEGDDDSRDEGVPSREGLEATTGGEGIARDALGLQSSVPADPYE